MRSVEATKWEFLQIFLCLKVVGMPLPSIKTPWESRLWKQTQGARAERSPFVEPGSDPLVRGSCRAFLSVTALTKSSCGTSTVAE